MRRKLDRRPAVPLKYRRYVPDEWPGGWGEWVSQREAWARSQPAMVITGAGYCGTPWRSVVTPLGDTTDLMRARREARLTASADVDSG